MKRLIGYGVLIATGFLLGRCSDNDDMYKTFKKDDTWYLQYEKNILPLEHIDDYFQLGDTNYQMKFLLKKDLNDIEKCLRKIKEEYYESNRISNTSGND